MPMTQSEPVPDSARDVATDDVRDELPDDLDTSGFVGPYQFPDNSRRRIPGVIYLVLSAICAWLFITQRDESALVNVGIGWAAVALGIVGVICIASGWKMTVDEQQALEKAQQAVGFAVGHASAQQVWHGVRSRPTWRVLCYSTEEPPIRRGLALIDAVDGTVIEHLSEDNPERISSGAGAG